MAEKKIVIRSDSARFKNLKYMKDAAERFDPYARANDIDAAYKYAGLLYSGSSNVPEDKEKATELWAKVFVSLNMEGFSYDSDYPDDWSEHGDNTIKAEKYKDIFIAAEYFTKKGAGPNIYLIEIAKIIQHGVPGVMPADPKRAFKLAKNMPVAGVMMSGHTLIESVRAKDLCSLFLGDCYMNGTGTKKNLKKALDYYLSYRVDYIAQAHEDNEIGDRFDRLYCALERAVKGSPDSESSADKYLSLAKMTMVGLGCIADPVKAREYLEKAADLSGEVMILDGSDSDSIDIEYLSRLERFNAKPYSDNMTFIPGEHVILGKYNNRSVFWKVLAVINCKVLLLADEVLETSRVLDAKNPFGGWVKWGLIDLIDFGSEADSEKYSVLFPNEALINRYLPEREDRICYYRDQALQNSYWNKAWGNNETAAWRLLSVEDYRGDMLKFVECNGEISKADCHFDCGIRPALFVDIPFRVD